MSLKEAIENCATDRIRSVAKSDPIYDGARDAREGNWKLEAAKDAKEFDKLKKDILSDIELGEKAVKPWQAELDRWAQSIAALEKEIAAEKEKIAQQEKEDAAVSKAIDEINAQIKEYNDSLILKSHDPRARPLVLKKDTSGKLTAAKAAVDSAAAHAADEKECLKNQKEWASKPIDELKTLKAKVSKAKFTPPKK